MSSTVNKASKGQLFGFSFNNASTNAVFLGLTTYFLIYCTEIYGMSPLVVGFIMTATRLFDAVTDPLIGILIDKTDTKFGRFRPWILAGSLISAFMFILMFSGIQTGSLLGNYILITVLYTIFIIGYTMQTACTKSAQNIISSDQGQRTLLNAFGMVWTFLVFAIILGTILPIVESAGGSHVALGWRKSSFVIGGIQLVFAVIVLFSLRKKDVPENYMKTSSDFIPKMSDYLDIFKNNKALQMLIVAASTNKIAQTLQSGMTVVFYFYVVQDTSLQGKVPIAAMLLSIVFMFASVKLISRFGRVEVFKWSSVGGFIYGLAMIPLIAIKPGSFGWLVLVLVINQLLIAGTTDQNLISMIGDAADYEYYTNNRFIPGMIGTSFSFIDKIISSLSTTLIGFILSAIGFVSISQTPRTPKMFWSILIAYCAIPALGHFFSIIGMHFHPLTKEKHQQMLVEIAKRDGQLASS